MAFKDDNYWGGNRTPSTNAQIRRPTGGAVSAGNKSGLSDAELEALLQTLSDPNKAKDIGAQMADPFVKQVSQDTVNTGGMGLPAMVTDLGVRNQAVPSAPVADYTGPSLGSALMGGAGKGIGDMSDAMGSIAKSLFGGDGAGDAGGGDSAEAIYNRLREEAGQYSYTGPSAEEMAKKQFDPQFALLDSLKKQTDSRYQQNKTDISGMYNGLVNSAVEGRASDQANFGKAVGTIGQNYKDATGNLTDSSTSYSKAMAEQLARLGINEGTGDVVAGVGKNLQDNVGRLNQQGAVSKDLLTNLGANEYAFDTRNIQTSKQAGLNTQEQFLQGYMDNLAQNDQQRLQLTGQQGQAENQYGMQIQDLLQKGQAAQGGNINETLKAILSGNQQETDNYFKQAGLNLDLSKFDWAKDPSNPANITKTDTPKLNPYDSLSQRALTQYKDPNKARQVVDEIMAQYQRNPNPANVADFINGIENQDALKQNPEMTSLIYDFINQVIGSQKK